MDYQKLISKLMDLIRENRLLVFGISYFILFLVYQLVRERLVVLADIVLLILFGIFLSFVFLIFYKMYKKIKYYVKLFEDGNLTKVYSIINKQKFWHLSLFRILFTIFCLMVYLIGYVLIVLSLLLIPLIYSLIKNNPFTWNFLYNLIIFLMIFLFSVLLSIVSFRFIFFIPSNLHFLTYFVTKLPEIKDNNQFDLTLSEFLKYYKMVVRFPPRKTLFKSISKIELKFSYSYLKFIDEFPNIQFKFKKEIISNFLKVVTQDKFNEKDLIVWIYKTNEKLKKVYKVEYAALSEFESAVHNIKEFKLFIYLKKSNRSRLDVTKIKFDKSIESNPKYLVVYYVFILFIIISLILILLGYFLRRDFFIFLKLFLNWIVKIRNFFKIMWSDHILEFGM